MKYTTFVRSFGVFCGLFAALGCQSPDSDLGDEEEQSSETIEDGFSAGRDERGALIPNAAPGAAPRESVARAESRAGSWHAEAWLIGGSGGSAGETRNWNWGPVKKIETWAGGSSLRGIRITHWDGSSYAFGRLEDRYSSFTFQPGETVTSCSLWGNGAGTRSGAFKITTNRGREYFPSMYDWGRRTEYPVPVGSGFMVGAQWRAGNDVDALGFVFVNDVTRVAITDMNYGRSARGENIGQGQIVQLGDVQFNNRRGTASQSYTLHAERTFTATDSFTNEFGIEVGAEFGFEGGVPLIAASSATFSLTTSYKHSRTHETSTSIGTGWSVTGNCPPRRMCYGEAVVHTWTRDLAYTGNMKYYLRNGATYWHPIRGAYSGVLSSRLDAETWDTR